MRCLDSKSGDNEMAFGESTKDPVRPQSSAICGQARASSVCLSWGSSPCRCSAAGSPSLGSAAVVVGRGELEKKVKAPACNTSLTGKFLFKLDCATNSILLLLSYSPGVSPGTSWKILCGRTTPYGKCGSIILTSRATNQEKNSVKKGTHIY